MSNNIHIKKWVRWFKILDFVCLRSKLYLKNFATELQFFPKWRNTCMIRERHVAVLPANNVSVFYMEPATNTQSHEKCTYMISWEHSHIVLLNYASISIQNESTIGYE